MNVNYIIFTDDTKDVVEIGFTDDDGVDAIRINSVENEDAVKLIETYGGISEVEKTTADWRKEVEDEFWAFENFKNSNGAVLAGDTTVEVKEVLKEVKVTEDLVETIFKEHTTEDLFKLKITIFEDEVVKESKNREVKAAIRKSKDLVEILALYHSLK